MQYQATLGNIMVIDDDRAITDLLQINLGSEGYNVLVKDCTSNISTTDLRDIHLIIVDAANNTPSGLEFISQLKSTPAGQRIGVIFFSEYESERTLIEALDAGADDSVRKPFSLREMLARVRAVMRRRYGVAAPIPESIIHLGDMLVDMNRKSVTIDNEAVNLTNTEYAILELLLHNANTYTSRVEIFHRIWPDGTSTNERIVDTNISRLRRKLGSLGSCIVNRSGLGYMIAV